MKNQFSAIERVVIKRLLQIRQQREISLQSQWQQIEREQQALQATLAELEQQRMKLWHDLATPSLPNETISRDQLALFKQSMREVYLAERALKERIAQLRETIVELECQKAQLAKQRLLMIKNQEKLKEVMND
ncbi:hypothetical protein QE197_01440 [Arsenophonus nasoniae]|uniref:Uncharacterized protein n=1 Tax=Arsenophonus nasoniae TaxID=638 RepID=A0A4P7KPM8_9GAMM|nr:hypothetical protein [Arsenophonus nasoniae]QBY41909.1 hypothetical protein ArsFIN_04410 [Arsenophonus nasoniae]WGL94995.1 hypothetical protein QE207_15205 [Arsenophonus nasoniae]WGM01885.1 hypothetical protein QE210_01785 [Arsenophonus nasoniae]WGM06122.1 hypothetical protein QE258_01700 [Arsenophonus nasoniae]WGM11084.1 hypothetical protein QE197_01440 [Arsenophonus nasoniae]